MSPTRALIALILVSISLCVATAPAHAAITVYTDEASFIAAIGSHDVETFENEPVGLIGQTAIIGNLTFSSPGSNIYINSGPHAHGAHNTTPGGSKYVFGDSGSPAYHDDMDMSTVAGTPLSAWGANFTDLEVGPIVFEVDTVPYVNQSVIGSSGAAQFFGFVATGSDSITTVRLDIPDITYGIDDVRTAGCAGYGSGCPGSGGFVPKLTATPCGKIAEAAQVSIMIEEGLGGAHAFLFFGLNQAAVPMGGGCTLNVSPLLPLILVLPLGGTGPGTGTATLTGVVPTGTSGFSFTAQTFVIDPGAPMTFSNSSGLAFQVL